MLGRFLQVMGRNSVFPSALATACVFSLLVHGADQSLVVSSFPPFKMGTSWGGRIITILISFIQQLSGKGLGCGRNLGERCRLSRTGQTSLMGLVLQGDSQLGRLCSQCGASGVGLL